VLAHTGAFEQAAIERDVHLLDGGTVYRTLGDIPWWLVSLLTFAACWVRVPKRGRPVEG
jgi:apolipoprotein N-acyltransferase